MYIHKYIYIYIYIYISYIYITYMTIIYHMGVFETDALGDIPQFLACFMNDEPTEGLWFAGCVIKLVHWLETGLYRLYHITIK